MQKNNPIVAPINKLTVWRKNTCNQKPNNSVRAII